MTLHKRLKALSKDPEMPRWCLAAIAVGFLISGPLDELVIYPLVVGYIWFRKRHVLARHGFSGVHVVAAFGALIFSVFCIGLASEIALKLIS